MKRIKFIFAIAVLLVVGIVLSACGDPTDPQTYSVTLPSNPVGYTVTGNATVEEGSDYTFTVEIATGYEKSSDFAVKVNGAEVTENGGTYTVENVSENLIISVDGVVIKTYAVTIPQDEKFTVTGNTVVTYGSDYTFTVEIASGYEKTSDFAVKVNGNEVTENGGTYTVENVTENLTITVEGVALQTYAVTIPQDEKFTVTGNTVVTYGSDYTFTVEIASGYEKTSDFAVKVNGNEVTENGGTYTVENVTANLIISVDGVVNSSDLNLGENENENDDDWFAQN